ncbi:polysaccharide lyase [Azospirillum sp. ST 5-10]|uniref:polysaccharide lyase n=1 Tax=unclassified Azospirillum TaxID=2630922 RepID=UPI003F4A5A73
MSDRRKALRKAMLATLPVLGILVECTEVAAQDAARGVLFASDFARPDGLKAMGFKTSGNPSSIVEMDGKRVVRIVLDHYAGEYAYRTELQPVALPAPAFDDGMFAKAGGEYWYGLRVFMPKEWTEPDSSETVLMQFHSVPDPGEPWRNPPVALQVVPRDGRAHFNLIVRADASRYTIGNGEKRYDRSEQIDLGPIDGAIGAWTDWVWNVRWNHDGAGFLRLYRDGKLVADVKGANCFNDPAGPYLKFGLYKYDWKRPASTGPASRTIYVDDLRVGEGADAFDGIAEVTKASGPA